MGCQILDIQPRQGTNRGGVPITITGTGFPATVLVLFTTSTTVPASGFYLRNYPSLTPILVNSTNGGTRIVTTTPDLWPQLPPGAPVNQNTGPLNLIVALLTPADLSDPFFRLVSDSVTGDYCVFQNAFTFTGQSAQSGPTITSIDTFTGTCGVDPLVINGTGFICSPSPIVTIGGDQVTVLGCNGSELTVSTPSKTGPQDVIVTNATNPSHPAIFPNAFICPAPVGPDFTVFTIFPLSGPCERTLFVNGAGFSSPMNVTVGGLPATVLSVNPSQIIARTNAGTPSGVSDVDVFNPSGHRILPGEFTCTPGPVIDNIFPPDAPANRRTRLVITGDLFCDNPTVIIGGRTVTPVSSTSTQIIFFTPENQTGSVDILVVCPNGTADHPYQYFISNAPSINLSNSPIVIGPTTYGSDLLSSPDSFIAAGDEILGHRNGLPHRDLWVQTTGDFNDSGKLAAPAHTDRGLTQDALTITEILPFSGSSVGGTTVYIKGTGFSSNISVSFSNIAATNIHVLSPSFLTAVTPPGSPGLVDVIASVSGQQFPLPKSFSYIQNSEYVIADFGTFITDFGPEHDPTLSNPEIDPVFNQLTYDKPFPHVNKLISSSFVQDTNGNMYGLVYDAEDMMPLLRRQDRWTGEIQRLNFDYYGDISPETLELFPIDYPATRDHWPGTTANPVGIRIVGDGFRFYGVSRYEGDISSSHDPHPRSPISLIEFDRTDVPSPPEDEHIMGPPIEAIFPGLVDSNGNRLTPTCRPLRTDSIELLSISTNTNGDTAVLRFDPMDKAGAFQRAGRLYLDIYDGDFALKSLPVLIVSEGNIRPVITRNDAIQPAARNVTPHVMALPHSQNFLVYWGEQISSSGDAQFKYVVVNPDGSKGYVKDLTPLGRSCWSAQVTVFPSDCFALSYIDWSPNSDKSSVHVKLFDVEGGATAALPLVLPGFGPLEFGGRMDFEKNIVAREYVDTKWIILFSSTENQVSLKKQYYVATATFPKFEDLIISPYSPDTDNVSGFADEDSNGIWLDFGAGYLVVLQSDNPYPGLNYSHEKTLQDNLNPPYFIPTKFRRALFDADANAYGVRNHAPPSIVRLRAGHPNGSVGQQIEYLGELRDRDKLLSTGKFFTDGAIAGTGERMLIPVYQTPDGDGYNLAIFVSNKFAADIPQNVPSDVKFIVEVP